MKTLENLTFIVLTFWITFGFVSLLVVYCTTWLECSVEGPLRTGGTSVWHNTVMNMHVSVLCRMDTVAKALEEVLTSALPQGCITVGVYEAAKSLNMWVQTAMLVSLAGFAGRYLALTLSSPTETPTMWCCASWPLTRTTLKTWPCRSTSRSFRLSAARTTSTSWGSTTPTGWQRSWGEAEGSRAAGSPWTCTASWSLWVLLAVFSVLFGRNCVWDGTFDLLAVGTWTKLLLRGKLVRTCSCACDKAMAELLLHLISEEFHVESVVMQKQGLAEIWLRAERKYICFENF